MVKKSTGGNAAGKQMEKRPRPDGLINGVPMPYPLANTVITALQVYHNPERRPAGDGPWSGEADKVAWVDAETGLGCIMLRQKNGTISGFVGVGPDHPLFGFEAEAVPLSIANVVHGGLTYGKECEANRFDRIASGQPRQERYTVCHVTHVRTVQDYRTVQTTNDEFHEDLWWLGFDTDHPGDFVPRPRHDECRIGDVYRDQCFVYANCIKLARRLKALLGNGERSCVDSCGPFELAPPSKREGE